MNNHMYVFTTRQREVMVNLLRAERNELQELAIESNDDATVREAVGAANEINAILYNLAG
jgi:hypothetical protein